MKFGWLGLVSCLFLFSCSSKQPATEANDAADTSVSTSIPTSEDSSAMLTIHGKDIWVRDSSSTGPVIMRLNEGDRCRVLKRGKRMTTKGQEDFWYQIDHDGVQGWVFGSQTDWRLVPFLLKGRWCEPMQTPEYLQSPGWAIAGGTKELAWAKWKAVLVELSKFYNIPQIENVEDSEEFRFSVEDKGNGDFGLTEVCGDGADFWTFHSKGELYKSIWITNVEVVTSDGIFSNRTLLWTKGEQWELSAQIEGEFMANSSLGLRNDSTLLAFKTGWWQPLMGSEGESIWMYDPISRSFTMIEETAGLDWSADENQNEDEAE